MLPMIYMALVDDEDLPAFESLYENNKDGAFKSANKILQNDALSEECVQEVFLAIAKNFKTISNRDAQEQVKYLYISFRNRAYNIIEKEKPAKNDMPLDEAILISSDVSDFKNIEYEEYIGKLRDTDQDILYAVNTLGLSYSEIAASCGISYEAVKQRHYTAKQNLKKILSEQKV